MVQAQAFVSNEDPYSSLLQPRRIRHIVAFHICNFTPFPERDTLASALSRPVDIVHGGIVDDLELTSARRRARKSSQSSVAALSNAQVTESSIEPANGDYPTCNRTRATSRTSLGKGSTVRPNHIARASSSLWMNDSFAPVQSSYLSTFMQNNSQRNLEKIVSRRLTETFLAVRVPNDVEASHLSTHLSTEESPSTSSSQLPSQFPNSTASIPFTRNGRNDVPRKSSPVRLRQASQATTGQSSSSSSCTQLIYDPVPVYLSSIHRPSTNPSFNVDARPGYDFAPWMNTGGELFRVEIWAPLPQSQDKGKGKAAEGDQNLQSEEWAMREKWDVNLKEVVPFDGDRQLLPFNTLLITLSDGSVHYVSHSPRSALRSRSPSPDGHQSDPESTAKSNRKAHQTFSRRRTAARAKSEVSKTAPWQDLLKLVTLQSTIADTEQSLQSILSDLDKDINSDPLTPLRRHISCQQTWIGTLWDERATVNHASDQLRSQIAAKKDELLQRRQNLRLALERHDENVFTSDDIEFDITNERIKLVKLNHRLPSVRTTLLTTLSTIYPIELLSPPDLLYTILGVPLPIPPGATDPAPPLILASHKEVTEDSVATALGYAAHLVQLLAVYLGKHLVYPITYVASRSLIRDGISAMVGPRMFPLYSKGVDTYRFEYGVFLLNKNIEMLMADKDLRALDMRHTLPNLKNLLLTLSDGEAASLAPPSSLRSFPSSLSDLDVSVSHKATSATVTKDTLENLTPTPSSSGLTITTEIHTDLPPESPESGTTTPTTITATSTTPTADMRRSRLTLGLSPLAGFLKARYPSAVRSLSASASHSNSDDKVAEPAVVIHQQETAKPESGEGQAITATIEGEEDEDDRRTITASVARDLPDDEAEAEEGKIVAEDNKDNNGNGNAAAREKGYPDKTEHSDPIAPVAMLISSPTI